MIVFENCAVAIVPVFYPGGQRDFPYSWGLVFLI